jgi:perosamine synthetase
MLGAPQPRFRIYTKPSSYAALASDVLTNRIGDEKPIEELEREVSRRAGVPYAVCMPTARTGIYLTLKALIKPGQKVLLSPITIVDVINMVIAAGGVPFFIDVEKNTCNVDAAEVARHLTPDVGAVLITHLHGLACDVEKIRAACDRAGVPLIEDAAQSFSTTVNGRWTGSFGRAGIFSFGMYKIVNAFFGGMVITPDEKLYRQLKAETAKFPFMDHGMLTHKYLFALATDISTTALPFSLFTYWFFRMGYLKKIDAILDMVTVDRHPKRANTIRPELLCRLRPAQASLILRQLDEVEANNRARVRTAERYDAGLRDIPELILPPLRTDGTHIYTYYPVRFPDRHGFMRYAFQRRRDMVLSHYHNTAALDVFKDFYQPCPNADATAKELVYLPTYPRYQPDQIDKNIRVIRDYFKRA